MAQKLQVPYPGASYHVMNRADRREAIFKAELADPFPSPLKVLMAAGRATSFPFSSETN
jgi:hypothetical protein